MSSKGFVTVTLGLMSMGLFLLACVPSSQSVPSPVPSVSPIYSASDNPSSLPSQSPSTVARPILESRTDGRLCEPLPTGEIQAMLTYPVDLAVTPDGEDIYIVSKRCADPVSQKQHVNSFNFQDCDKQLNATNTVPRSYIYHLKLGKELEILKIDGKPPLSCELGEDIEIDSQGRLYLTTPHNHRIYRIDPKQGTLEQMVEAKQKNLLPTETLSDEFLKGPANLFVDNKDRLYFRLVSGIRIKPHDDVESHLAVVENGQKYKSLVVFPPFVSSYYTPNYAFSEDPTPTGTVTETDLFVHDGDNLYRTYPYPSAINPPESFGIYILKFSPFSSLDAELTKRDYSFGDLKLEGPYRNIYVSHPSTNRLLKMTDSDSVSFLDHGSLYLFAGSLESGFRDGASNNARFNLPMGLTLDAMQNLYVADMGNHAIRKITPERKVTTLYGKAHQP